jgi:CHAD domain-containing protein
MSIEERLRAGGSSVHQPLDELTGTIEQAAAALRAGYDAEQLYALRVASRRVRSILKHIGSHRARRLRKTWGAFVAVTNRARDWDVFLITAGELMPAADFESFRRDTAERVRARHDAVQEVLHSAHWRQHLAEWKRYLARAGDGADSEPVPPSLDDALARAGAALALARTLGDERSWHKFRIAVKEVRYLADAATGAGDAEPGTAHAALIESCKELQSLLGAWHDSVIQLQLLEDLEGLPQHGTLQAIIDRRRKDQLAAIEAAVGSTPFPAPTGASPAAAKPA